MIKKTFYEETMDSKLNIVIWTETELSKHVDDNVTKTLWAFYEDTRTIILNMDEIKWWTMFMKTITHELLHFVWYRLRSKWIDHTTMTEEIYCYMYDFYFGKILEWINKTKLMNTLKKMAKK